MKIAVVEEALTACHTIGVRPNSVIVCGVEGDEDETRLLETHESPVVVAMDVTDLEELILRLRRLQERTGREVLLPIVLARCGFVTRAALLYDRMDHESDAGRRRAGCRLERVLELSE
jgi:hypothetical protein